MIGSRHLDVLAPWRRGDVVRVVIAHVAGAAAVLAGWYGSSGRLLPGPQIGWLTFASVGAIVSGLANAGWLVIGRRTVAARQARVISSYSDAVARQRARPTSRRCAPPPTHVVAVPGRSLYHRPDCALVASRPRREVDRTGTTLAPCQWCQP